MKITAKDFFLHLGAIVTFYASVIALITMVFEVINYAYPKVTNGYLYYMPSISMQVATLVVAFPLFVFFSWLLQKSYAAEPALRDASIRKWLSYITLFAAGAILAGDLIAVIYMFLDGQELTTAFLLKVLTLIVVMGGVFGYYLREIRNQIGKRERYGWRAAAAFLIAVAIAAGFSVIGSPSAQRQYRYDMQKITSLQNLQWGVVNYWQQKSVLPSKLSDMEDSIRGNYDTTDPETGKPFEYKVLSDNSFELCANFNRPSRLVVPGMEAYGKGGVMMGGSSDYLVPESENWAHDAGRQCFERTIDPDLYPPFKK